MLSSLIEAVQCEGNGLATTNERPGLLSVHIATVLDMGAAAVERLRPSSAAAFALATTSEPLRL